MSAKQVSAPQLPTENQTIPNPVASPPARLAPEDMAQLQQILLDNAYNRLEIIIAVSIGFFAVLITVLIIFFALRTQSQAIAAAKAGVEGEYEKLKTLADKAEREDDSRRQEALAIFEDHRQTLDHLVNVEIPLLRDRSEAESQRISIFREQVENNSKAFHEELMRILSEAKDGRSSRRNDVAEAIASAKNKSKDDLSVDDFLLLLMDYSSNSNWWQMGKTAVALGEMHDTVDAKSSSLFYQALAQGFSKQNEESIRLYDRLIETYGSVNDIQIRRRCATARFNRCRRLVDLRKTEEAIEGYNDIVTLMQNDADVQIKTLAGNAMVNFGVLLARSGNPTGAIEQYHRAMSVARELDSAEGEEINKHSRYNIACAWARQNNSLACIAAMEDYRESHGVIDRATVDGETAFDLVRDSEDFQAYVRFICSDE